MESNPAPTSPHIPIRNDWLSAWQEQIVWPDLPIIDAHHHLWDRPSSRYMMEELNADILCGHNVVATVFIQSRSMYKQSGEEHFKAIGEIEFANGVAACFASGLYGNGQGCAGIVAGADLTLDTKLEPVLEKMIQSGGGRLKGIRNSTAWHAHPDIRSNPIQPPSGLLNDDRFIKGVRCLQKFGLSLDIWAYHTQLKNVYELAKSCPDVVIILDHMGGPLGVGPYAGAKDEVFNEWRTCMGKLASLPNVNVKLGGFGLKVMGYQHYKQEQPPSSDQLATQWRPYIDTVIELFGVHRCMYESNFPVDKGMYSYHVMWNSFKKISLHYSSDEIANLFHDTARRVYNIDLA